MMCKCVRSVKKLNAAKPFEFEGVCVADHFKALRPRFHTGATTATSGRHTVLCAIILEVVMPAMRGRGHPETPQTPSQKRAFKNFSISCINAFAFIIISIFYKFHNFFQTPKNKWAQV
jgi:hypothetical protein